MTRRRLLRLLGLAGLTGAVGWAGGVFGKLGRWLDRSRSRVALVRCDGYGSGLGRRVALAWDLGGAPDVRGRRVVLKPNLVDVSPGTPINTDPRFVGELVDLLRQRGAREVVVGEGPGNRRDVATVLGDSGLGQVLMARGVTFADLNTDDVRRVKTLVVPHSVASRIPELMLPATVLDADVVISVAKLKTHHWTGVTLTMKNLFGVVPGAIYGWPKNLLHWNGIDRSVLEVCATVRPAFGMVDGIVGMEGDGPLTGTARESGLIVAGSDLVAVDAVAARVMGVAPERIGYLLAGEELGHGRLADGRIDVFGERVESVAARFALPEGFEHLRA